MEIHMDRPRQGGWRVGIDIGGTFTDVVAIDPATGAARTAKVRTRRDDPLACLRAALSAIDLQWRDVGTLVHGTTLVTNAIVEGMLPPVALIATAGFTDVLAIGRQNRRHLYSLDLPPKLPPLVPEERRFGLRERIGPDGAVKIKLDPAEIDRVVAAIRDLKVASVAVALLHAYANPEHEIAVGERLAGVVPHVSLSHRVNPEEREYERTSATALNAAVMPLVGAYLDQLGRVVPKNTQFNFFHSAGGMAAVETMRDRPLSLALSGPAAGAAAAQHVARDLALDNALALDMGGTTTDVCLLRNGKPEIQAEASLADWPLRQPMVAVKSIGAGGGSLAYVEAGTLRVGPSSAGAAPGPACYGLGGEAPTVTDANLLLGYLDPAKPLADSVRLDLGLAERAISRLAAELRMSPIETALGIVRVADANMLRAIRNITVDRGIDGRKCTLVAFGGAGPLHAATLARAFGIGRVVVPAFSSAYSAFGCALAELSYTRQCTVRMSCGAWSDERLSHLRDRLLSGMAIGDESGNIAIEDRALIRYVGQSYSVEVPYRFPADARILRGDFLKAHQQLYGFASDEEWQIDAIRVTASAGAPTPISWQAPGTGPAVPAPRSTRRCWFNANEPIETPRYRRDDMTPGKRIAGPAIVEDEWSTITIPPGAAAKAHGRGHLVLECGAPR